MTKWHISGNLCRRMGGKCARAVRLYVVWRGIFKRLWSWLAKTASASPMAERWQCRHFGVWSRIWFPAPLLGSAQLKDQTIDRSYACVLLLFFVLVFGSGKSSELIVYWTRIGWGYWKRGANRLTIYIWRFVWAPNTYIHTYKQPAVYRLPQ